MFGSLYILRASKLFHVQVKTPYSTTKNGFLAPIRKVVKIQVEFI